MQGGAPELIRDRRKLQLGAVTMARFSLALLLLFICDGKISGRDLKPPHLFLSDKVMKVIFVFQALKVLTLLMAENLPPTHVRTWPRCCSGAGWSAGGLWSERTSCSQRLTVKYLCKYFKSCLKSTSDIHNSRRWWWELFSPTVFPSFHWSLFFFLHPLDLF